ncbi:MAG: ATP-binding cassette domain-containing protein [Thiomicrorhabdus sp.]|nr:ATP-binding cassette domain-containing protein [Thiomicrorhabdus sp.]
MVTPENQQITLQDVSYQLANNGLLQHINTQFNCGEISVILGKNGAGKSTLLSLLTKELSPTEGQIIWQDTPLKQLNYAQLAVQRAVLPQQQSFVFSLSVQQLVELGAEVQPKSQPAEVDKICQQLMALCDVQHLAQRDVVTLSGGEQKRAQLAKVLAQIWPMNDADKTIEKPFLGRWLLLDEWTNSLDLHHQQRLAKLFKTWAKAGLGIVMVLHDINLCAQIADKVVMLNQAKLTKQGSPAEVLTQETIYNELSLKTTVLQVDGIEHPVILPTQGIK